MLLKRKEGRILIGRRDGSLCSCAEISARASLETCRRSAEEAGHPMTSYDCNYICLYIESVQEREMVACTLNRCYCVVSLF